MDVGDLPDLGLELLGVEHGLDLSARSPVQLDQRWRPALLLRVQADDQRVGGDALHGFPPHHDVHGCSSWASFSARPIMSVNPSVTSSSSTRSMGTQPASAASLPAVTTSDSG